MIFFDYDGVLADSLSLWIQSCKFAASKQGFCGEIPANPYKNINPVTSREVGKNLGLESFSFEKDASLYFLEHQSNLKLFENTIPLLQNLKKNHELYIMSATPANIIKEALKRFEILGYFSEIYGGNEESKASKLKKYATKKAIMIGDSISDIEAAKLANVFSIGVLWGWQDENMLKNADILVKNHNELNLEIGKFYENHPHN